MVPAFANLILNFLAWASIKVDAQNVNKSCTHDTIFRKRGHLFILGKGLTEKHKLSSSSFGHLYNFKSGGSHIPGSVSLTSYPM